MKMWIYPHDRRFRHERLGMDGRQATPVSASDPRRCADLKIIADGTVQMLLDTNKQGVEQKRNTPEPDTPPRKWEDGAWTLPQLGRPMSVFGSGFTVRHIRIPWLKLDNCKEMENQ